MSDTEKSAPTEDMMDVDVQDDDVFNDNDEARVDGDNNDKAEEPAIKAPGLPEFSKKDKTLHEILEMMEDYYPIIPDAVTDYYLTKNGLSCDDVRIKRVLALATQKFISDIATDAYEYSRIRSSSTVYNSANPQVRARALVAGASGAATSSTSNAGNSTKKVVLTMDDLSSALAEYGVNVSRPDFYR